MVMATDEGGGSCDERPNTGEITLLASVSVSKLHGKTEKVIIDH